MKDISGISCDISRIADQIHSDARLATRVDKSSGGLILEANKQGLIVLASALLGLASRTDVGAHLHLDANSYLDEAELPLIVSKK
jgi:hypothetical protein